MFFNDDDPVLTALRSFSLSSQQQTCFDLPKLRNEVYCQVIKQTLNAPAIGSPLNMVHWHLLATLCNSFLPSRKFLRYLRFHLRRTSELSPEKVCLGFWHVVALHLSDYGSFLTLFLFAAGWTRCDPHCQLLLRVQDAQQAARLPAVDARDRGHHQRQEPCRHHQLRRRPVRPFLLLLCHLSLQCVPHHPLHTLTTIPCSTIDIPVSSSTSCGEVIAFVKKELGLQRSRNGFGLFESCGMVDKYLEDKVCVGACTLCISRHG